jgi:hypothetical protein
MTQSPQPKTFTNFELTISIRLHGIYLLDLHQLIAMPHICVTSALTPKAVINSRKGAQTLKFLDCLMPGG